MKSREWDQTRLKHPDVSIWLRNERRVDPPYVYTYKPFTGETILGTLPLPVREALTSVLLVMGTISLCQSQKLFASNRSISLGFAGQGDHSPLPVTEALYHLPVTGARCQS